MKTGIKIDFQSKNAIENRMDEIYTDDVRVARVPNGHISFSDFFGNWILPNFQFRSIVFNFQKLPVIKNCIDFQFTLTCPKVKNAWILKVTLIFNSRWFAQNSKITKFKKLTEFSMLEKLYCCRKLNFESIKIFMAKYLKYL